MLSVVLLAGGLWFAQGIPGPQPAPEVHVTNTVQVEVPQMDPEAVSNAAQIAAQTFIVNVVQPIPVGFANDLCTLPDIWRQTPPEWTYQQGDLKNLSTGVIAAGLALITAAIFTCGLSLALGQGFNGGRVALAAVLVTGNLIWWEIMIRANNAISQQIGAPDLCASLIKPHIQLAPMPTDPGAVLVAPVLVIVYAVVSIMLLLALFFRLAMIDVLMVTGGIILATQGDPRSDYLTSWYWRISIGTVFGQVLLVIALQVAAVLSNIPNGSAGALLGIAVLWLCTKLLSMMGSANVQGSGRSIIGVVTTVRRMVTKVI
jgi:hypothetical protein